MQVLDWSMQHSINVGRFRQVDQVNDGGNDGPDEENLVGMDENVYEHEMGTGAEDGSHGWDDDETRGESFLADGHQDLISGMDVNQAGTLLASCSIDGTVRVWDVLVHEFGGVATERTKKEVSIRKRKDHKGKGRNGDDCVEDIDGFLVKVDKFGCPIRPRSVLTGHIGIISDRQKHRSIIGIGSVIEGYQVHDLKTGEKLLELDEPLTSRQHHGFESEIYQNYASKIAITPTVIVTTSKIPGRLCIWDRDSGELSYRIHICPSIPNDLINFGGIQRSS
ncbi:hypothetical protein FBU30_007818 [Linnemannia zychae]|nr:hypothetical protein FBU30_007818 [Linnemannia zychae]